MLNVNLQNVKETRRQKTFCVKIFVVHKTGLDTKFSPTLAQILFIFLNYEKIVQNYVTFV